LYCNSLIGPDHIDKGPRSPMLNRSSGYDIGIVQCVNEQLNIDELIGKQDLLIIVEYRSQLGGPGRCVDLIVDRFETALTELGVATTVIARNRQVGSGSHLFHYCR